MAIKKVGYDIYIDQFDCGVDIKFNLKNSNGTPFDLTGYTAQLIVKKDKDDEDVYAIYSTNAVCENNTVLISIDKTVSSKPVGSYFYAIRLIKRDFVNTILQASFNIVNNTFESGV